MASEYFATLACYNHQTEHRGEARALLAQTEAAPPSVDLTRFIGEHGAAPTG